MDDGESIAPPSYHSTYPPSYQTNLSDLDNTKLLSSHEWLEHLTQTASHGVLEEAKRVAAALNEGAYEGPLSPRCVQCGRLTSCQLESIPVCCSCSDERPQAESYAKYVDGEGYVASRNRRAAEVIEGEDTASFNRHWAYCPSCKRYWDREARIPHASKLKQMEYDKDAFHIPPEMKMFLIGKAEPFTDKAFQLSLTVVSTYDEFRYLRQTIQEKPSLCEVYFPLIFQNNDAFAQVIIENPTRFRQLLTKSWSPCFSSREIAQISELYQYGYKLSAIVNYFLSSEKDYAMTKDELTRLPEALRSQPQPQSNGYLPARREASASARGSHGLSRAWYSLRKWKDR